MGTWPMTTVALIAGLTVLLAAVCATWAWLQVRKARRGFEQQRRELAEAYAKQTELQRAQAATAERDRIYRDLHDDLGAQLLDLVYQAPTPQFAERARAALAHIRGIVADARRSPAPLHQLLEEIEIETRRRLEPRGVALIWERDAAIPNVVFDEARTLHLLRIVREALNNALKHGVGQRLRIRSFVIADDLMLDLTDDGAFNAEPAVSGSGTRSMQERTAALHGQIAWQAGTWGGTKVALRVPLQ